ncbi:MAG: hypothetical protein WCW17_04540, partial [Patescibacteria group bacterium]
MNSSLLNKGRWFWQKIKPRARLGFISIFLLAGAGLIALFVAGIHPTYALDSFGDSIAQFVGNMFLGLAAKFMALTVFVLKFVIEIASYNHYINAPAVQLGWVLVRDVTNMFFVLILMLIAFGTVLGIEQYEWKKLLVKFVLAAILVNFSRLICGVMIDAAQVFMMTFISGVAATAGGNLVNALHMNDILSFSSTTSPVAMSDTMNIVISGIMSFVFAGIAFIVIGAYLFMLIARVIALWILIILSPLAFVLGVVPKFQSYATQWWTEFTNNVLSGPVLAFFLWLAFAVAGGANIHDEFGGENAAYQIKDVQTEAAAMAEAAGDDSGTNANMILDWENLANFILAAALMIAGVKTTQKLSAAGAGMLGSAAGAATKFAMVASGAAAGMAAAKWAGKTAASGAKAVALAPAKYVGKKAQAVGLAIQAGAYSKADQWNRFIEHRAKAEGKTGVSGWVQRRLMLGTTSEEIATRKKKVEAAKTRFGTSIAESESLKQSVVDIETETERGMGFKEKAKADRLKAAYQKLDEKKIPVSGFLANPFSKQELSFNELTALSAAKAQQKTEEFTDSRAEQVAEARDKATGQDIFANSARAKIQKRKMEEMFSPMSREQLLSNIGALNKKLEDPNLSEDKAKDIKSKIEMAMTAAHLKSGGRAKDATALIYGDVVKQENAARIKAAVEAGEKAGKKPEDAEKDAKLVTPEVDASDIKSLQAHYLSMWLHKYVEATDDGLESAWTNLQGQDGKNHKALMAQRVLSMNQAAEQGHVNAEGLFMLGEDANYKPADNDYWKEHRDHAVSVAVGKTDGFKGVLNQRYNEKGEADYKLTKTTKNAKGKMVEAADADVIQNGVGLHSGLTKLRVSRMLQTDVDTWEHIIKNTTDNKALEELFEALNDKVSDKEA